MGFNCNTFSIVSSGIQHPPDVTVKSEGIAAIIPPAFKHIARVSACGKLITSNRTSLQSWPIPIISGQLEMLAIALKPVPSFDTGIVNIGEIS